MAGPRIKSRAPKVPHGGASCRGSSRSYSPSGLALILGLYTRWVAVFLGIHLLFAAYLGHLAYGWMFTAKGGGYEYPLFWAIGCFALALMGDGAYALKTRRAAV